jgi:subtilisin family serine protease
MKIKLTITIVVLFSLISFSQDSLQTFLSLSNTGVSEFLDQYPEYDGRGTIIIVMDTGVDMGIDGLIHTTTGEVKVIDVQDFTGEGDVDLYPAEIEEDDDKSFFINEEMNYKVSGAANLTYRSVDNEYFIGAFREASLINSSSKSADLNDNGNVTDSYMIISFKTLAEDDQFWIAYIDTDADGDISDEFPKFSYKDYKESFAIKTENGLPLLTMGLNIFPDEKRISLHFDDGAHGTHCAGIAAGNDIGATGLNGVAPGAYIISCKLGNNLFSGGASVTESMKKSFLYADKISRETEMPCIINLSFGIGSEIEGKSEMEIFIDQLIKENPYLYVSKSNGNDGPGISTIGLPSASKSLFSSGAVLPQESGRDLYGTNLDRDIILHFSSRGGEVNKPDLVSPGAMTSTVPNWTKKDRFWGTSMSSPYTAGVMALLLSAMEKEFPDVKISSHLLFTALKESATIMEGYSYLDQGSGYINVPNAYKLLKTYVEQGEVKNFETYSINTIAPNMPDGKASNLYIRNGSFLNGDEKFNFTIKRNNIQKVDKFYRVYKIRCEDEWLLPVQEKIYIRNDQSATVTVKFDKSKMTELGLYSGKIKAYRNDNSMFPEFEMLATVVIPYSFSNENNFQMQWTDKKVKSGDADRYFINVPWGQNSMKISLGRNDNNYSMSRFNLYDPDGIGVDFSPVLSSIDNESKVEEIYYNLDPGVYELDIEGYFKAEMISEYNLSVKLFGINRIDDHCLNPGNNTIQIINSKAHTNKYLLSGEITGYRKIHTAELNGSEHFFLPFTFESGEASKTFKLNLNKADFNKLTDFAFLILDESGFAVKSKALNYKTGTVEIVNNGAEGEQYKLELIPGFSHETGEMKITIDEDTEFDIKGIVDVTFAGRNSLTLYPNTSTELRCDFDAFNLVVPTGGNLYGKINLKSVATDEVECEIPVCFSSE